jgi:hypothetical protein
MCVLYSYSAIRVTYSIGRACKGGSKAAIVIVRCAAPQFSNYDEMKFGLF